MLLLSFSVLSLEPLFRFSHLYLKPLVLNLSRLTTLYCIFLLCVLGIISLLITSLLVSTICFRLIIIDQLRMTPRHLTTDPESFPCFEVVFCFSPYVQVYQVLSVWEKALEPGFLSWAGVGRGGGGGEEGRGPFWRNCLRPSHITCLHYYCNSKITVMK